MRTAQTILAAGLLALCGTPALAQTYTTFTILGNTTTAALAINGAGTIAGTYIDNADVQHGFVRAANGTVASFDPPGADLTLPTGIDKNGTVVGIFQVGSAVHGFLRTSGGTITTVDPKRAAGTWVTAIHGMTIGYYSVGKHKILGFARKSTGHISRLRYPEAQQTEPTAINDVAVITGNYRNGHQGWHGFLLTPDGAYTPFDAAAGAVSTTATGISRDGTVAGTFQDAAGVHGFVRAPDGTLTPFDVSGGVTTSALGINTDDTVFGNYTDATAATHGYQRPSNGVIATFDVPNATSTFPHAINNKGVIVGTYADASGGGSFIRTP